MCRTRCIAGSNRGRRCLACRCRATCSASFATSPNDQRSMSCGHACTAGHRRSLRWSGRGGSRGTRPRVIVVDARVRLELLVHTPAAEAVKRRLFDRQQTLHAAHLLDVEVAHVLRRYVANGEIDGERGRAALTDLADLPLQRYPHDLLLPRVWELRHNLTAYDAVYIALAEALDAPLLTRDRRFATVPDHRARVELV